MANSTCQRVIELIIEENSTCHGPQRVIELIIEENSICHGRPQS
jgi:hypothetical protein